MNKRRTGLSLIETIISVVLLSVVVFFVLNLLPSSLLAVRRGGMLATADSLAQNQLENAQARDFADLALGERQDLPPVTVDQVTYRPFMEVDAVPEGDSGRIKRIQVTVEWSDLGRVHTVTEWAYVSRLGR